MNIYNPSTDYNSYTTEDPFKYWNNYDKKYGNGNNKNPWDQDYNNYATSYSTEDPFKYLNNFDQKYNNFDNFDTSSYNFDFNTKK